MLQQPVIKLLPESQQILEEGDLQTPVMRQVARQLRDVQYWHWPVASVYWYRTP